MENPHKYVPQVPVAYLAPNNELAQDKSGTFGGTLYPSTVSGLGWIFGTIGIGNS